MQRLLTSAFALLALAAGELAAAPPPPPPDSQSEVLRHLRPGHPRLLFTEQDQARIQKLAQSDPFLARIIEKLRIGAEADLDEPVVQYKLIGPRLLPESRKCLSTVLTCAMAWRLIGDTRFAERAKKEMLAAAALPDWHPPHFLDVAEMTAAVAVGYDWLYGYLSPEEREVIREAIVRSGLEPSKKFYPDKGWAVANHNWNQVCNGGMALGALAIADEKPALASEIVSDAMRSIPNALAAYAPDGLWVEGPGYWDYGTTYTALFVSALKSALGTDGGVPATPGLDKTGEFFVETIGPNRLDFNYADVNTARAASAPALFWLAETYRQPFLAHFQRGLLDPDLREKSKRLNDRFFAMNIAWYEGGGDAGDKQLPLARLFHGRGEIVAMRSAWNDPRAIFAGFKGGDNTTNHAHLDIGSFVLDANGQRWAIDLGSDNYDLPGYFDVKSEGKPRWRIYRLQTRSHNTLLIGDRDQPMSATAHFLSFKSDGDGSRAVLDMTAAYAGQVSKALRGVAILGGNRVLIEDEVTSAGGDMEIRWGMMTRAEATPEGAKATLVQKGEKMHAEILEPAGAHFEVASANPGDPAQDQNVGACMLVVRIPIKAKENTRIIVLLTPDGAGWAQQRAPLIKPLSAW